MYSPLQIILLGAALAAAAPIFPDITLTERSTKSFPPNSTKGTAPNNDDPPPSEECRIADFALHMCMTQPGPVDPRECETARAAFRKHCLGREDLDNNRKLHERYHPEDAHVPVTVPTHDIAPHNGTHRVDLHPVLEGCDKELRELEKCKAKDSHYDGCVVEQANYSQCKKHEEIIDLIRKMLEKDPPVDANVTAFVTAAANGTVPTNDDPEIAIDPEGPVVFARVPAPDSLPYMLTTCNAKGYAKCLSEGREDCDAGLAKLHGCVNQDLVRWLFAPGPKSKAPGATFKLLLQGQKGQQGNIIRDGKIIGNVYEAGARVHIAGDVVLHGRVIGNAFEDPDV